MYSFDLHDFWWYIFGVGNITKILYHNMSTFLFHDNDRYKYIYSNFLFK